MGKNVIERISDVLQYYNVTPNELAKKIGISSANAYNYVNGRVKEPPLSFIISFLEVFDEISAEWLLRGNGPIIALKNNSASYVDRAAEEAKTPVASEGGINFYDYFYRRDKEINDQISQLQKQINEMKPKFNN